MKTTGTWPELLVQKTGPLALLQKTGERDDRRLFNNHYWLDRDSGNSAPTSSLIIKSKDPIVCAASDGLEVRTGFRSGLKRLE